MTFAIDPGSLGPALEHAHERLKQSSFVDALWTRRLDVWAGDAAVRQTILNRLGWLDAVAAVRPALPRLRTLASSVKDAGITDVVLLGMGGSSLVGEVLRGVIGVSQGFPRFHVLDSVDPDAVRSAMERAGTSLFILASKSGSTIELTSLAAEADRRVRAAGIKDPGSHFVAITDTDTALHRRATDAGFRDVFINPSDIGGRFSALSFFGMVPAALMGIDVEALLDSADGMAATCRTRDPKTNSGLALGAMMAAAASTGRDKLTVAMPDQVAPLGLWIEQLVAESTGKHGKGVIPIVGEAPGTPGGDDRLLVTIELPSVDALGAEFFRWEFATATAGWLLDVNPFDEPNVQQAKDATRALLDRYAAEKRLPVIEPDASVEGVGMTLTKAAKEALRGDPPLQFLDLLCPGDYLALLAYLPPDEGRFAVMLQKFRAGVGSETGCATMLGYGPRYLHSTGQLHKGGPSTGVFVIVTADAEKDLPIPGEPYSFGVLEAAQALGDFQSLDRAGRRALHLHLPKRDPALLQQVTERLLAGV